MSIADEGVSFSLEVNVETAYENIRKIETVVYRLFGLFRRLGLPEKIDDAIMKVQRLIAVLNSLRLTIIALQAASGPLGLALALMGLATTAISSIELLEIDRGARNW